MTRLTHALAGVWTEADQRNLDRFLKDTPPMPAPASHTRKTAYNATMAAIDELSRVQIHAMSSGQALELTDLEKDQLRETLEDAKELARMFERSGDWS